MEKEFVPYVLALRMKALGFDEPCSAVYFGNGENELFTFNPSIAKETTIRMVELGHIACPTFSQAFKWFEEKYDNSVTLKTYQTTKRRYYDWEVNVYGGLCNSKYEAELACLDKLIEIVEGIESQK